MRIVLVGAVESSLVALQALIRSPLCAVSAVVTLPPSAAGRHSDFADLASPGREHGIEVLETTNVNSPVILDRLRQIAPDILFVIGWSQLCKREFLDLVPGRVVGYHPAALPRLRGRAPIAWTILRQEPITASTLFWMNEGTDSGDILDQHFFHVAPEETAQSLYARHMEALALILDRSLALLAEGRESRVPQDERCATWGARRRPEDGCVDWRRPASDVLRLIRAVGRPYPGAYSHDSNGEIRLWDGEASLSGDRHAALPGQVVERTAEWFVVQCGDGQAVRITSWSSGDGRQPALHSVLGGA